jgi:hypothetical protein
MNAPQPNGKGSEISLQQYVADCWLAGMTRGELLDMLANWKVGIAARRYALEYHRELADEFERSNIAAER